MYCLYDVTYPRQASRDEIVQAFSLLSFRWGSKGHVIFFPRGGRRPGFEATYTQGRSKRSGWSGFWPDQFSEQARRGITCRVRARAQCTGGRGTCGTCCAVICRKTRVYTGKAWDPGTRRVLGTWCRWAGKSHAPGRSSEKLLATALIRTCILVKCWTLGGERERVRVYIYVYVHVHTR